MGKIWDRNPSKSEVIGRCGGDEKTRMPTQNRQKSNAQKTKINFSPERETLPNNLPYYTRVGVLQCHVIIEPYGRCYLIMKLVPETYTVRQWLF